MEGQNAELFFEEEVGIFYYCIFLVVFLSYETSEITLHGDLIWFWS